MFWLPVALLAPAFSALGNYIDKYLLVSHKTGGGIGAITIFSCLFSCIVLPLSYFLGGEIMSVGFLQAMILIVNGFLSVSALLFYLYAIDRDSVLLSIPILQVMPVFAFVLGYFILGETLSLQQALGSFIVIGAAVLFSLEINSWKDISLKKGSLFLIVAASLPLAAVGVIFKWAALDIGYWTTQFWEYVGIAIFGLILFVFVRAYRQCFLSVFSEKSSGTGIIGLNLVAEILMVSSDLVLNFATLLAPVALVYVANSFHPAFVFLYGIIFVSMTARGSQNIVRLKDRTFYHVMTVVLMIAGALLLYS